MDAGKKNNILYFPGCENFEQDLSKSNFKLKTILEALTLGAEKGILTEVGVYSVLDYLHIDPYYDLIYEDRYVLNFHLKEYYGLSLQF